jgi:hypothetical protein
MPRRELVCAFRTGRFIFPIESAGIRLHVRFIHTGMLCLHSLNGKRTYTPLAVTGKSGKATCGNGRTGIEGQRALHKKPEKTGKIALGAGNGALVPAEETMFRAGRDAVVPRTGKPVPIYGPMKKTDKEESLKPARVIERGGYRRRRCRAREGSRDRAGAIFGVCGVRRGTGAGLGTPRSRVTVRARLPG